MRHPVLNQHFFRRGPASPSGTINSGNNQDDGLGWEETVVRLLIQIVLVALGSAVGGVARWGVGEAFAGWLGSGFPYGTLFINISGSLFLGWFLTVLSEKLILTETSWVRPDDLRLVIAVGFTGAYTTFSTFEYESHGLLRGGDGLKGAAYILLSLTLGLLAVRVGVLLARWHAGGPK
jgi:CrcB protein